MERSLGLMCGAGVLPARMAEEARRQGWRVLAFTFAESPGLETHVARLVPSRLGELGPVLATLQSERVSAVLFSGKFWLGDVLRSAATDDATATIAANASSLAAGSLAQAVVTALDALGIEVLDQRGFTGDWLAEAGCWTRRKPGEAEWADVHRALAVARMSAETGIGQTVIVKRGIVLAVEALEGTSAAIRRGTELGGAGAVVAKAVATANDYRFDTPTIGPETIEDAARGAAAVVATEARRVFLLERARMVHMADEAGIALVTVDGVDVAR